MITGKRVRDYREQQGWTVRELAAQTGIHFLTLARFEKGTATHLNPTHMATLERLVGNGDTEPPTPPILPSMCHDFRPSMAQPSLETCAELLASYVCGLDPTWRTRLEIMQSDRGFTMLQAIATCVAYVMEHELHMMVLRHEALEPNPWRRGERMECPHCHTVYDPRYPGEPFCSNACATSSRRGTA
jgi:hypothetical protein